MAQSQQEILTAIAAAEAELSMLAGYEESYPEFYDQLTKQLNQLVRDYAAAMGEDKPYAIREPEPESTDAVSTAPVPSAPHGQSSSQPKPTPQPRAPQTGHIASQDVTYVAGRGDVLMLLHWKDKDERTSGGGSPPAGGGSSPPASGKRTPPAGSTKPGTDNSSETVAPEQPAKEAAPSGPPAPQSLTIVKVEADKYKDGYNNFQLRSDVAELYNKVREEATKRGAIITSSGGIRSLTATVGSSRSATSFHYSGRALDLYIYSGMCDPKKDPYVVVREQARVYRVYARCNAADAEVSELKNVMTYHKRDGSGTASGSFFDLTALFKQHGFERIRARESFEGGGDQLGAEWWHFQCERGLVSGKSTFGEELLAMYSEATLKPTPPWEFRNHVFGVNWK